MLEFPERRFGGTSVKDIAHYVVAQQMTFLLTGTWNNPYLCGIHTC